MSAMAHSTSWACEVCGTQAESWVCDCGMVFCPICRNGRGGLAAPSGPCPHWVAQWDDDGGFTQGPDPYLPNVWFTREPTDAEVDEAFGEYATIARDVYEDGFDSSGLALVLYDQVLEELGGCMVASTSERPPGWEFRDVFTPDPKAFTERLLALAQRLQQGIEALEARVGTG
jgi:hypothetical protein